MNRILLAALALLAFVSCTKEGKQLLTSEEMVAQKIGTVIPRQYLDTLRSLGLELADGINPPNVEGTYRITPHVLEFSNIPSDLSGRRFADAEITFSTQNNSNYTVSFTGVNFLSKTDTCYVTAISGKGNEFTVYGKARTGADEIVIIITGIKDGNNIKYLRTGFVNVTNIPGTTLQIKHGQARIGYDADFVSERK